MSTLCLTAALLGSSGAGALHAQVGADAVNKEQAIQQSEEKKPAATSAQAPPAGTPAAGTPAAPSAAAQAAKPTNVVEPKIKWTGSITGGFQFSRGQTNANGVSVTGDAQYAKKSRGYRFEGVELFAKVRTPLGPGVTQDFTAQDRRSLYFTFFQEISGPVFLVSRASAEHDVLRDVKYRFMDLTGIGFRLAASTRLQAFVAPGIGFARENKPGIRDGSVLTPGIYQRATWHISRIWTLDQWFQYRGNVHNSHDYSMDGYAGVTGLIWTTKLGFNFAYIYSYEGLVGLYGGTVVPQLPFRGFSQTTIGLRFQL